MRKYLFLTILKNKVYGIKFVAISINYQFMLILTVFNDMKDILKYDRW